MTISVRLSDAYIALRKSQNIKITLASEITLGITACQKYLHKLKTTFRNHTG